MANAIFYILITTMLVVGAGYFLLGKNQETTNSEVVEAILEGGIQKVTLGIKDYNYYPNTIKVKVDYPVRIYLDESVVGCYRSFTLKDFGIAENLETSEDYVEFTPTEPGIHAFACSMGMGTGTLIVE